MKIRKAESGDAEGVANVLMQSYNISSIEEGKSAFDGELKKGHSYVIAEDNGNIVGITSWKVHGLPKHQLAELDRIAVLPEAKGKGVAQRLFTKLVQDADIHFKSHGLKLRKLFLMAHADNQRAKSFYKKIGFIHEATLKDHYYTGKDEMVFSMYFD